MWQTHVNTITCPGPTSELRLSFPMILAVLPPQDSGSVPLWPLLLDEENIFAWDKPPFLGTEVLEAKAFIEAQLSLYPNLLPSPSMSVFPSCAPHLTYCLQTSALESVFWDPLEDIRHRCEKLLGLISKEIYAEVFGCMEEGEDIFGGYDNELLYQEGSLWAWPWEMDNTFVREAEIKKMSAGGGQSK